MKLFMCIPFLALISRCSPNVMPGTPEIPLSPRNFTIEGGNSQPHSNSKETLKLRSSSATTTNILRNGDLFDVLEKKRQIPENSDADDDMRLHILANHEVRDKEVNAEKSATKGSHVVESFNEDQKNSSAEHETYAMMKICIDKLKWNNETIDLFVAHRRAKRVIPNEFKFEGIIPHYISNSSYGKFILVDENTAKDNELFNKENTSYEFLTLHYTQFRSMSITPNARNRKNNINSKPRISKLRILNERDSSIKSVKEMLRQLFRSSNKTCLTNRGKSINLINSEIISITTINESSKVMFSSLNDRNAQYALVAIILGFVLILEIKMLMDEWNVDLKIASTYKRCKKSTLKKLRRPRSSETVEV